METRDAPQPSERPGSAATRAVWHVFALLLALAVAWLVFAAYRQPDFILDFAGIRLC